MPEPESERASARWSAERWAAAKKILAAAFDLPEDRRKSYLAEVCGDDAELCKEVESLLSYHDPETSFMEYAPIGEISSPSEMTGQRLGIYQIVQKIGEGGMGSVYQALRDDDIRKLVAIKVVKRGMDTDYILRRFFREREILAHFDHPNIGKLLDVGTTTDGRPYFVMEFIGGLAIDEYCEQQKLSIRERLDVFLKVCATVEYAHQNLVVHRDLKPRNILITPDGDPKLLDFGIAKLLDDQPDMTVATERLMTLEYASPEQVRGEAITTATDVYSLGVMLYELLTGERPYRLKNLPMHEAAEVICNTTPTKPSLAAEQSANSPPSSRMLRGDLDNIMLMALRKEPPRRYSSVGQFAEDIRRYLESRPVISRKDTFGYRAGKFVKRNKVGVAAGALVFATLMAGVAATLWQAHIATEQRARAERRFNDVRKLANSLMFDVHDAIQNLQGSTPARKLIVQQALQYLDSLAQEASGDASLQQELAAAYEKVGDVQGGFRSASLGDSAGALKSYEKALTIRETLALADPRNAGIRRELVRNHGKISDQLLSAGNSGGALEHSRQLLAIVASLTTLDPNSKPDRRLFATAHVDYGLKLLGTGDWKGAIDNYRQAISILEALASESPADVSIRRTLAVTYNRLGQALEGYADDLSGSLAAQQKAVNIVEGLRANDPKNTDLMRLHAYALMDVGQVLEEQGDARQAIATEQQGLATFEALAGADPANVQSRRDLAFALSTFGGALLETGAINQAGASLRRALTIVEALPTVPAQPRDAQVTAATTLYRLGDLYARMAADNGADRKTQTRYWREARTWYEKSMPLLTAARDHGYLPGRHARIADEVVQAIRRCDQALTS